ncbi:hypothetical protein [Cystobacter ferrugineus]|uniref:Uncharacterized protein n=1 Tax=Cystobacter ferrugineus TaxID=83449 RepID=A0A1L9AVF7_9BACT|nr:hypothetical protein [Cystobacter ferrugineus]OJH33903.1 hypothetical protein BON30_46095 [Cystobacter ferrugineus]
MTEKTSNVHDFSDWTGSPFYDGQPSEGRHVYIVVSSEGTFVAFGMLDGSEHVLFEVKGLTSDLQRFLDEMQVEGAEVTFGTPPINTNTGGDKATTGTTKPGRGGTK